MAMLKGNRRNKVMPQFYRFYSSESIKKSSEAWLNQQGIAVFARFNIMNVEIPNESIAYIIAYIPAHCCLRFELRNMVHVHNINK